MIRALVCLILIVTLVVWVIGFNNFFYFVDIPSLMLVIPPTVLTLIMVYGSRLKVLFLARPGDPEAREVGRIGKTGLLACMGYGGLGTIVGMVLMLQNLDDPAALGPGLAVCGLCGFWSILISLIVFLPLMAKSRSGGLGSTDAFFVAGVVLFPFVFGSVVFLLLLGG